MLMPQRVKYRRVQEANKGKATRGNMISYGEWYSGNGTRLDYQ